MNAEDPRIVVTGGGMIASIGAGSEEFESALYAAKPAFSPSEVAPGGGIAAEVRDFTPQTWLGKKGLRALDRSARLLCVAAHMAIEDAALDREDPDYEPGLACGTMFGSVRSIAAFDWSLLEDGPTYVNPMHFPNTVINAPAGQAALRHGLRGVNSTCCAGLASGLYGLQYAADSIRFGRACVMLAGGVDEVSPESLFGFERAGLSVGADGDGAVPGEGAALWALESAESAAARGVTPLVEISGFGCAHDARAIDRYSDQADGAAAAIEQALEDAEVSSEQIACVVCSASGSPRGDEMEAEALRRVFGERLGDVPVTAPKALLGETLGAGGAFAAMVAGIALQRGLLPPTAGSTASASGLRLSGDSQPIEGRYALVNAFGCDGNNASLVVKQCRKHGA